MRSRPLEEPDITPLINVNLVILVMVMVLASHAAKLLPLALPKSRDEKTTLVEISKTAVLRVEEDGTYQLSGRRGVSAERLAEELKGLADGSIVLVSVDPKARYAALVRALDALFARPTLQVAFGQAGEAPVRATLPRASGKE